MSSRFGNDPELWFHGLATHYVEVQILFHLNQVGVISLLAAKGPLSAEEISQQLDLNPRVVSSLLEYVTDVDSLLRRDGEGRFALTEFGTKVLERFGRKEADGARYNFFDVRAGAYGPVWNGLERLMRGGVYGRDVTRAGPVAAEAVYKLVTRLEPTLRDLVRGTEARTVVELGVSTGLLERLGSADRSLKLRGVDRSASVLETARARAELAGVHDIKWIAGDVFEPESWLEQLGEGPGLIFSVHFHEFIAGASGVEKMRGALRKMASALRGWTVVAFEQPLVSESERASLSEAQWLYAQSNVLIHHLIGNGRILGEAEWLELFKSGGIPSVQPRPVNYLGYQALFGSFEAPPQGGPA